MRISMKGMTKRQKVAYLKKKMILSSEAFREWWRWRRGITPVPSDPYRAFMIDIGLYARIHHKEVWKRRVNWMDYPPVDLPKGAPAPKRRLPPRKHIKRFKPRPKPTRPIVETPLMGELRKEVERFTEKYHLPTVRVKFERRGGAAYLPRMFGTPLIAIPSQYVEQAEKIGGVKQQIFATVGHETGHHGHAAYGGEVGKELASIITQPYSRARRIEKERIAWKIAKKHRPFTPIMKWRGKVALGTYLGTTVWGRET